MTREEFAEWAGIPPERVPVDTISVVTEDSRRAVPGAVFFALKGDHADGHDFADAAAQNGAALVVGSRRETSEWAGAPYVYHERPRALLGMCAHAIEGDPSRNMVVVGVTGTNGKSSTVTLIQHILRTGGIRAAAFGTLGNWIGGESKPAAHTTPFAEELAEMFAQARNAGDTHAVMEVSSHALEQDRVAGIDFDAAVFTNLTQDHLDYHPDMESYRRSKLRLFELVEGSNKFTVVNHEDPSARDFVQASRTTCYTFGTGGVVHADNVKCTADRTRFDVVCPWGSAPVALNVLGRHNVDNALAAITVCCALGLPLADVAAAAGTLDGVPGRFEHVDEGQDFQVIVDYAHTEDGLRNVLASARPLCENRLITVFGCGGDRDKTKRPKMAAAVAELSDFAIITSDNPRTEDPERIILDTEVGMQHAGQTKGENYETIVDRAEAIQQAIDLAAPGDVVVIAGKGHEDYQILGERRIHFDDREVARAALLERFGAGTA